MNPYIIIPAYNEASVIAQTLKSLVDKGYTVVLVDDCSQDKTGEIAQQFPIHYLRHGVNLGQGAALQTGMDYVKKIGGELAVHFDADGQHRLEDIPAMIAPILSGEVDAVLGSRFLNKTSIEAIPIKRRILLRVAWLIDGLLTGLWLSDVHNGFRAFNRKALESIRMHSNGMAHASEIKLEIKRANLRYTEVPVVIDYTEYSQQKGQSPFNSVNIVLDLIARILLS